MHYARTALKLREQIIKFSGELSAGLPKVGSRFIEEAIYGIQARRCVHLTEIARALGEKTRLRKTEYRLSRQLGRRDLWSKIVDSVAQMAAKYIKEDTLLVIDPSDIRKKYAEKMEHLARVRDCSEGEIANGYWTCNVIGTEIGKASIIPLYSRLYSQAGPDFQSENTEIRKAVDKVSNYTQGRGIWVMDRGGDRRYIIHYFLSEKLRFIIRSTGERHMIYRGKKISIMDIARTCTLPYAERIVKEDKGKERLYYLEFGYRPVKLPERKEKLYLVVIRGFGQKPMMLLKNIKLNRSRKSLWKVVESYMSRWKIEETIRFIKQSYQVGDIRLLTYKRLQNMMALVLAVDYFAMVYLGIRTKLKLLAGHALKAAQRVFGVADFRCYAIADGIREFFFSQRKGSQSLKSMLKTQSLQLNLFDT